MRPTTRTFSYLLPCGLAPAAILVACNSESGQGPQTAPNGFSAAYGIWTPGPNDTCPVDVHNRYTVIGPDGKLYPTWHPPVDPVTGCRFGHEHGRNPRGSKLYGQVGSIPFGYANEQLDIYDPNGMRHEDHFGHKVEWENDIPMRIDDPVAGTVFTITCDFLTKLHQGTHSKDAFTNNLHELVYHLKCSDGTELHVTILTAIGTPGEFVRSCDGNTTVAAGAPTPANSPNGGGQRLIPDRFCVNQFMLVPNGQNSQTFTALHESWQTSNVIRGANGQGLAFFNPYYQVDLPSRFYDAGMVGLVGRPIDACYETEANGDQANSGPCNESTNNGQFNGLVFDDPRSTFNGVERHVDLNSNIIHNAGGPQVWYTDPFGEHGRQQPFPGSIAQFISAIDNDRGFNVSGPAIGFDRYYGGPGSHAPN